MDCEGAKNLIIAQICGDLDPDSEQWRGLKTHLSACRTCAQEYENAKRTVTFIQEHKLEFAEALQTTKDRRDALVNSWQAIEAKIDTIETTAKNQNQLYRLIAKVSAVAACFIICLSLWLVLSNPGIPPAQTAATTTPSVKIEELSQNRNLAISAATVIRTPHDDLKTLIINDRHRIVLNSNTTLSIRPLAEDSRVGCLVSLTLGEIFVHVEHDGNPFAVATSHGKAVITGTAFNIKATNNTTTLAVTRGSVQFGTDITFVEVLSGQLSKVIGQSAPTTPVLCDAAKLTAWATGHKAERILAQIAQSKSYSDRSELPQSSSGEPIVSDQEADGVKTAAELIEQAHKHDAAYTLGASVNRPKALSLYQSALTAEPDQKRRLHVLYRMAQLYGTTYRKDKGETSDYHRAISLYKEIIDSYPPEELLVYKAASSICDHYTTLREFETAVKWAKQVLEYDTSQMAEKLRAIDEKKQLFEGQAYDHVINSMTPEEQLEIEEQIKQGRSLEKTLAKIKRYQEIAVDQVAYSAEHIDILRAQGELRAIAEAYSGTFIAERAHERLIENMDKVASLWAPQNDEPFSPSDSTLQAAASTPTAHSEAQKDIQIQSNVTPDVTKRYRSVGPNIAEIPQKDKHVAIEPRAPPLSYISKSIIGTAGLVVLALAAIIIRKRKTYFKGLENEKS